MNGRSVWREEEAETSLSHLPKRQKTSHHGGSPLPRHDHYTIAWICALHIEMAAALAMLDEVHEGLPQHGNDSNTYVLGSIKLEQHNGEYKQHNIVIACLPAGQIGTNNAANVMTNIMRTFPAIRAGLMVGIGGGVPSKADVRLGDIVVGTKVIQYDLGKAIGDGQFLRTAIPKIPHHSLGTAVSALRAKHLLGPSRVPSILQLKLGGHPEYSRPSSPDRLFDATYYHNPTTASCDGCDQSKLVPRSRRKSNDIMIHYGTIASGNQVRKCSMTRDKIAQELGAICFEMEAAGLMDILPCLSIRGICDYSDSHKNDEWQMYAAATAAAYARELLEKLSVVEPDARVTCMPNSPTEANQVVYKLKRWLYGVELVPFYTGRCKEIAQIRWLFQQGRSRITVVLSGLGGIGKTQIALKYAKVHENEYDAIYWVNCRSMDTVKQSLFAVAERIHHQNPSLPGWKEVLESQDLEKASLAVIDWLSQIQNDRWLVICDGYGQGPVDDPSLENWNLHRMIRPDHGHILITSRWPQSDAFHHISVEKFTDMSLGVDLLLKCSKKQALRNDPDVQRLAQTLDGLPLALVAAGTYLRRYPYSCAKYLDAYNRSWLRLLEKTPTSDQYHLTLYSTWDLTLERICKDNELAASLLRFCAYFDNNDLWFELFQTKNGLEKPEWLQTLTNDELEFSDAVGILHDHAMIELPAQVTDSRSGSIGFRIHNCVHSWTIHVLNRDWDYGMSSLALGCIASKIPRESTPSFWHISQRLLAHASRIVDLFSQKRLIERYTEAQVEQMQDVINFFLALNRPETVEKVCMSLHEEVERTFGYYHQATFTLKWLMIGIFTSLKRYQEAETLCTSTLEKFSHDPDVNEGRAKRSFTLLLARNCILRGQTERGMELLLGSSTPSQEGISGLRLEKNLISLLWTQYLVQDMPRDMQTWTENLLRKEETGKARSCQESFDLLCTQIHLCLSQNENEEAKALLVKAREMFDEENSADYAKAFMFSRLAALYVKLDEYGDLKSLCENATTGDWESLWQSALQISCNVILTRCFAHVRGGQLDETVALCQQVLNKLHNSQVPGSALRQCVLIMLGSVYMLKEELLEAEKHFAAAIQEIRESKQQCTSASYEHVLATMSALAERYRDRGEQDSAQRCLKLVEKCQGELLKRDP